MSGLYIVYNGKELIKHNEYINIENPKSQNKSSVVLAYSYKFIPYYKINHVVTNSPADKVGLLKGDVILKMNNKPAHYLTLNDIYYKLQEKNKKKIKLTIERNGEKMKFEFKLKKEI